MMNERHGILGTVLALLMLVSAPAAHASRRGKQRVPPIKGVVNINEAPVSKLVLLPYIGKGKARAIVRYRKSHRFSKPADLVRVAGIGRKTFVKIKAHVTVTGSTTIRRVRRVASLRRPRPGKASGKASRSSRRRGGRTKMPRRR